MIKKIAKIILIKNGRFLLQLRDNRADVPWPNYWGLFGGKMEPGETSEETLRRELKEELNYDLKEIKYFKKISWQETDGKIIECDVYSFEFNENLEKLILNEGQAIELFSTSEINEIKIIPQYKEVILDYVKENL